MNKKIYLIIALFTLSAQYSIAQKKVTAKTQATKPLKIKPPHLRTFLGVLTDSIVAPIEQVKAVLGAPLKVMDVNNNLLTLTYYQFLYKRKAVTEDEKTGKLSPTTSTAFESFTTTPLPARWVNIIKSTLVAGEELYFFDVIAKDSKGFPFYAPNLKIITK